jgi:pimeloyl-ACP methyl ester carboxylesterase
MASRIGGFKTAEDAARYHAAYDAMVANHWPGDRSEMDFPSRFGSTHVRSTGSGDGVPLVMIHPTQGSSAGWYPLVGPLGEGRSVYTPDTIGTVGRSHQTQPIESVGDLALWLDETLDHLELDRVHLFGYSEGGWIAGSHAALTQRSERLKTLTLVEPAGAITAVPKGTIAQMVYRGARTLVARDRRKAFRDFNRWMNGNVELSDEEIDLFLLAFGKFTQRLPTPTGLSDSELRSIGVPTLLILAEETRLYDPDDAAERARRLVHDIEIEIVPDAGHGVLFQYPDRMVYRITSFLRAHD